MKAIIIEDEPKAATNLKAIIQEIDPKLQIVTILDSIQSTVDYFKSNPLPDLLFMDIQLADGQSFLIFDQIDVNCPVIFTTAYDAYALEAFKVNSIDYLLKPIEPDDVKRALYKLKNFATIDEEAYAQRLSSFLLNRNQYTNTFLITYQDKLIPLPTAQIAFFYTKKEIVTAVTHNGKSYHLDKSLDTLMSKLDPSLFFRANRQFIIAHRVIKDVAIWFGNRLSVQLSVPSPERIIISKARVALFKNWLIKN